MTIVVCVDDKLGMMFNRRRQSRDREVIARILKHKSSRILWTDSYSASLFDGAACADDAYAVKSNADDLCFVEGGELPLDRADRLIVYRWHRVYPADRHFPAEPTSLGFVLISTKDFAGFSHEVITEEVFIKHEQP